MDAQIRLMLPVQEASPSHESDAWQLAVNTHLASLTASQRTAFIAPTSADDCIKLISCSNRVQGFSRILDVLKPIVEPLRRFEAVIDVLVQTNGGICSPIWGPLRFAIMVASDHIQTIEKLARILQRIVASLERYNNYETLFKNNLNTQRAIGALYTDLLDLCTLIVKFHSRSPLTGVFVSFDKEFQQVSDNISHHSTEIDWAANAANIEESKSTRHIEDAARLNQLRSGVQRWLCPSNIQDDLYRHQRDCMTDSCNWALEIPDVQTFFNSASSQILRIGGAPGSGKSTLATFLIGHITKTITNDVLYFFCKGSDEKKSYLVQVLRTLTSQLLARDESLYPWFETVQQQSGHETAESFAALQSSLQLALSNTTMSLVYIVVDALDECRDGKELALSLLSLMPATATKKTIKILATCREEPELLDAFDAPIPELKISQNKVNNLVSKYVEARVSKCKHISKTALGREVHIKVTKAANGLWLFARLMMDEIQRLPSPASIKRQLQNIPSGIIQLYQQIFATMESSFTPLELRLSQQVLLWLDISDFVQRGQGPLIRAVLDLIFQAENDGEEVFDSIDLARRLCSPLIDISEDEGGEIEVRFVHHTAAQFVRMCSKEETPNIPRILRLQPLKVLYRGSTSLWFFQHSSKSDELLEMMCLEPNEEECGQYYEMTYGLWDAFLSKELPSSLDAEDILAASKICDKLTAFLSSKACLKWVEMDIIINYCYGYPNLYQNATKAAEAGKACESSPTSSFRKFSVARTTFFADYAYVVSNYWPMEAFKIDPLPEPERFETRWMAKEVLALGKCWLRGPFLGDIPRWMW